MEVHRELGSGFLEPIYQEALALEFADRGVPFVAQELLPIRYKTRTLESQCKPDFICYREIIVEIKALADLTTVEDSQLLNYLKATGYEIGLLLNFGKPSLQHKRLIRNRAWNAKATDPTTTEGSADLTDLKD